MIISRLTLKVTEHNTVIINCPKDFAILKVEEGSWIVKYDTMHMFEQQTMYALTEGEEIPGNYLYRGECIIRKTQLFLFIKEGP